MHLLLLLFRNQGLFHVQFAQANQVIEEVLRDLDCLLGVEECLLMAVQLREQSAHLHVDLALVLQLLQLFRWFLCERGRQIL